MISQMTPAGYSPAIRARSTAASVWPARTMHAAGARPQRKHVAGPREIATAWSPDRSPPATVAARSAAEMPVVVRPFGLDRHAERGLEPRRVLRHHQRNLELVEPLRRHRQADQPAAVPRHEVDRFGRDLLGGDRQIALVLAILIVDDDDHLAGANRLDRVLDPRERTRLLRARLWRFRSVLIRSLRIRSRRSRSQLSTECLARVRAPLTPSSGAASARRAPRRARRTSRPCRIRG